MWSEESALRLDSSDQIQIRISEIHDLSVFLGKDLKKVFLTSSLWKKNRYATDVYRSRKWSFFGSPVFLVVKNPCDLSSQIRVWILPKKRTQSKGLILWAGLAIPAEVTFIPVIHEKGQTGAVIFIQRFEAIRMSSVLPAVLSLAWFIRRTPGNRDYLENFHPGSRHHNTGMPANRAGSVELQGLSKGNS